MSTTTLPAPARPEAAPTGAAPRGRDRPRASASAHLVAVALVLAVGVLDPWGLRPFTTVRWPLVAALLLLAAALGWRDRAAVPPVLRAVGIGFLAWMTLATAVAVDPVNAWLGHPQRHLGWVGWVVAAAGFLAGLAITTDGARRTIGRGAIVASAVLSLGAALDLVGVDIGGVHGGFGSRAGGFLGQPAFLGAAGVLLVPVALGAARTEARVWRWCGGAAALAGAGAVVASQTRGAWLGFVVAAIVAAPLLRPRSTRTRVAAATGVVVLVAVVVLTPLGTRAVATFDVDDGSTRGRLDEWRVATAVVAAHPMVGVGPEGYRIVAPAHIDDDYTQRHGREVVVDRAHDGVLDVAVTGGIPAAVLYVALVGLVLVRAVRARRDDRPLVVGAAAGLVGYAVQQLVLFPVAELDPLAWALAGVVLAATAPSVPPAPARRLGWSSRVVAVGAVVLAGAIGVAGTLDVAADHHMSAADRERSRGDHIAALAEADAATRLRPDSLDTWYVAAEVAASGTSLADLDAALDRIEAGLERSPRDPALADRREQLLAERALRSGLPDDLDAAEEASRARRADDPANPVHHRWLGVVLAAQDDRGGADAALERALALDPDDRIAQTARDRLRESGP